MVMLFTYMSRYVISKAGPYVMWIASQVYIMPSYFAAYHCTAFASHLLSPFPYLHIYQFHCKGAKSLVKSTKSYNSDFHANPNITWQVEEDVKLINVTRGPFVLLCSP